MRSDSEDSRASSHTSDPVPLDDSMDDDNDNDGAVKEPPATREYILNRCLADGAERLKRAERRAHARVTREAQRRMQLKKPMEGPEFERMLARAEAHERAQEEKAIEREYLATEAVANTPFTPKLLRKFQEQIKHKLSQVEDAELAHLPGSSDEVLVRNEIAKKAPGSETNTRLHDKLVQKAQQNAKALKSLIKLDKKQLAETLHAAEAGGSAWAKKARGSDWAKKVVANLRTLEHKITKTDAPTDSSVTKRTDEEDEEPKLGQSVEPDGPMVDLTEVRAGKGSLEVIFDMGDGYSMECGMVSYTAGNQHGCYEAITIKKKMPPSTRTKNPAPLTIVLPIRALRALYLSVQGIRDAFKAMTKPPTAEELQEVLRRNPGQPIDLTSFARVLPKLSYKLDDMITMKSEKVKWGKAVVDVLTFARLNKDPAKNPFTIQLPATLFPLMEVAVNFIYHQKFEKGL